MQVVSFGIKYRTYFAGPNFKNTQILIPEKDD